MAKTLTASIALGDVPGLLAPGMTVYVQPGASEPTALLDAIAAAPDCAAGVTFVQPTVPGVNRRDLAALHPDARQVTFFLPRDLAESHAAGRIDLLPLHYFDAHAWVAARRFDLALIRVAPPDANGKCSLGVEAAFTPDAVLGAAKVVAALDSNVPAPPGAPVLDIADIDLTVETDDPLLEMAAAEPDETLRALGTNVAQLVADGDTIEMGIGTAPAAILAALSRHSDLGIHTGLLSDSGIALIEAGVATGAKKNIDRGRAVTGLAIGTERLYRYLAAGGDGIDLRPVSYTHDPEVLGRIENFRAINTVIEIDLFGQGNGETIRGKQVSGTGGLADFVRAAR
ncbi:MAG: 4-hydroxybutyrate CoA-transferase, partial [Rhodospirillaceae bacterium]|nr:4-hydroxybutyrate CoA-transferase [Rhodospirillaceae bacterium]